MILLIWELFVRGFGFMEIQEKNIKIKGNYLRFHRSWSRPISGCSSVSSSSSCHFFMRMWLWLDYWWTDSSLSYPYTISWPWHFRERRYFLQRHRCDRSKYQQKAEGRYFCRRFLVRTGFPEDNTKKYTWSLSDSTGCSRGGQSFGLRCLWVPTENGSK